MLSLYTRLPVTAPGPFKNSSGDPIQVQYTLYGDDENKDRYYLLPNQPTFMPNPTTGDPSFSMIWYYGPNTVGGICTFTVALPMPNLGDPAIRKIFTDAIRRNSDLAFRAKRILAIAQATSPDEKASIAKEIGLTDKQVEQYVKSYKQDQDYTQFLPSDATLDIQAVPVTGGKVMVRAFADPGLYKSWQKGEGAPAVDRVFEVTPSFLNSNAAVVSFNLTEMGACMFWFALGGPSFAPGKEPKGYSSNLQLGVVTVEYSVIFDAVLPAAEATVTLSHKTVMGLVQTRSKDTWGHVKTDTMNKTISDAVNQATTITLPSSKYLASVGTKASIRDNLQDWAKAQLENMMASQVPGFKLEDLKDEIDESHFSHLQEQSRTYKLSQAIEFTAGPQGQLPMVTEVVKKGTDLDQFFKVLDLNDRPYFKMDLVVSPLDKTTLSKRRVDALTISRIAYGGQPLYSKGDGSTEVHSIQFRADSEKLAPVSLVGTFDSSKQQEQKLEYSYIVTYAGGAAPYKVTGRTTDNDYQLMFSEADLGVVYATISGHDLPWGVIDEARVTVRYDGAPTRQLTLTSATREADYVMPIGRKVDKPLEYQVEMLLKGGGGTILYPANASEFVSVDIAGDDSPKIYVKSGFSRGNKTYKFLLGDDSVKRAQIRAKYQLPNNGRSFETVFSLPIAGSNPFVWEVPAPSTGVPTIAVLKARTYGADGKPHDPKIEAIDPDSPEITVTLDSISGF